MLLKLLNIPPEDVLKINASRDRTIEVLQPKIIGFIDLCGSPANPSGIKYVLLDEADKLSHHVQSMLRNEIETYSHCTRFLFTCNQPHKIIPAIHSRVQEIKFPTLEWGQFLLRAADVLNQEEISWDLDVLQLYAERTYPDLRKCIGLLQLNSRDRRLLLPQNDDESTKDYLLTVIDLFKSGRYLEGRKLILKRADPEEYEDLYRFFYEHLELFGSTQSQQDDALLTIRRALVHHAVVADKEINLAACITELTNIAIPI
jgi:DNA polymerase III delta prime subunit